MNQNCFLVDFIIDYFKNYYNVIIRPNHALYTANGIFQITNIIGCDIFAMNNYKSLYLIQIRGDSINGYDIIDLKKTNKYEYLKIITKGN